MATQWTAGLTDFTTLPAATLNQIGAVWETFNPVATASGGSITSYVSSGRYARIQKLIFLRFQIGISNKGTGSGALNLTIPFPAQSGYGSGTSAAVGSFVEWTSVGFIGAASLLNSTTSLGLLKYDWTSPIVNGTLSGFAIYEAA